MMAARPLMVWLLTGSIPNPRLVYHFHARLPRSPLSHIVAASSSPSDAARQLSITLLKRAAAPPIEAEHSGSELLATVVEAAAASASRAAPAQSTASASAARAASALPSATPGGLVASLLSAQGCLTLARGVWADVLCAGDTAIDATCGNGHDAAELASLLAERACQSSAGESPGRLIALDVQPMAVETTHTRVKEALRSFSGTLPDVEVLLQDHAQFPAYLAPGTVRLIVYNLGYLPGGDKTRTTTAEGTIRSLVAAQKLLAVGGALTVMCYPAHPEGCVEAEAVLAHLATLNKHRWRVLVCRPSQNENEKFLIVVLRRRPDDVIDTDDAATKRSSPSC